MLGDTKIEIDFDVIDDALLDQILPLLRALVEGESR